MTGSGARDGFIKLIRMLMRRSKSSGTVVSGISHIQDAARSAGSASRRWSISRSCLLRADARLIMATWSRSATDLARRAMPAWSKTYVKQAESAEVGRLLLTSSPTAWSRAGAPADILQVLLFAILFGFAVMAMGERGAKLRDIIDDTAHAVFVSSPSHEGRAVRRLRRMAYTIGKSGRVARQLIGLIALFYVTAGAVRGRRARPDRAVHRLQAFSSSSLYQG